MNRSFKQNDKSIAARKFYILSVLLFSLVLLSSSCSLIDCTGCVMAGVILAGIFYLLFGWIPYIGPILVLLALYLFARQPVAQKMLNESCGASCSVCSVFAETNGASDQ